MLYQIVKTAHVTFATFSLIGFILRSWLMFTDSTLLKEQELRLWFRVVPHLNDSLLLAAAAVLCVVSGQYPFVEPWITGKVVALVFYIGLGMLALGRRRTRGALVACAVAAVAIYVDIAVIAVTKSPLGIVSYVVT